VKFDLGQNPLRDNGYFSPRRPKPKISLRQCSKGKTARYRFRPKDGGHGSTCALRVTFYGHEGDCQLCSVEKYGIRCEGALQTSVRTTQNQLYSLKVCSTPSTKATCQPKPETRCPSSPSPIARRSRQDHCLPQLRFPLNRT